MSFKLVIRKKQSKPNYKMCLQCIDIFANHCKIGKVIFKSTKTDCYFDSKD